ncbi:MAG: CoA pyrophosphatase [bacterium]
MNKIPVNWHRALQEKLTTNPARSNVDLYRDINNESALSDILKGTAQNMTPAAVLVPIIQRSEPMVVLTRRSDFMPSHAGQISFPGGRVHPEDDTTLQTALRETEEETGIAPAYINILGRAGQHFGGKGFAVTAYIGMVEPGFVYQPCPREVAEIFEVPFSFLMDPANSVIENHQHKGNNFRMFSFTYQQYHIWGLTAGIIQSLAEVYRRNGK